ncbi:hypothetical protein OG21DRAFT_1526323, partial [Imleria badia]
MSLTTTLRAVKRTAHLYAGSLYILPYDEEERQRLLGQHQLYTRLLSGRLVITPTALSDKDDVLDIGTGGGAWLYDARTNLPEFVQLYGIDIASRLFPSYTALSADVHLSVCSATDLPAYWSSKFALVHQRLLICAYTRDQWRRSIDEMYRVLTPGGSRDRKRPGTSCILDEFLGNKGMLLLGCGVYIVDMLKAAGFIDIKSQEVVMNLAGEDGAQGRDVMIGALKAMRDSVMRAGGLGQFASAEEFDKAMKEIAEEWDNMWLSCTASLREA